MESRDKFILDGIDTGFYYTYDDLEVVDRFAIAERKLSGGMNILPIDKTPDRKQLELAARDMQEFIFSVLGEETAAAVIGEPVRFTRIIEVRNALFSYVLRRMTAEGAKGLAIQQ